MSDVKFGGKAGKSRCDNCGERLYATLEGPMCFNCSDPIDFTELLEREHTDER